MNRYEGLEREGLEVKGDLIVLQADDAVPVQPVIDLLRGAGVSIREIREAKLSLEDIFLQAVQNGKEVA